MFTGYKHQSGATVRKASLYLLPISILVFLTSCSSGETKESAVDSCRSGKIEVTGEAPVFTSVATSRNRAKEEACRQAISFCVGDEVSSRSGVGDGQSLGSELYSRSRGICKNGEMLSEEFYKMGDIQMHRVQMSYGVTTAVLDDTIHAMQQMVGNPKIIVLIREEMHLAGQGKSVAGFNSRKSNVAAPLRDFLAAKGYTIIDGSKILGNAMEEVVATNPGEINEEILDRAQRAGADVMIVGQVETHSQSIAMLAGSDFKSYSATGTVAIQTLWGKGKVLGEFSESVPGAQVTDIRASQVAMKKFAVGGEDDPIANPDGLAKFVHERLSAEWGELTRNNVIVMHVKGLSTTQMGTFKDDLNERTAVKRVNDQSLTGDEAEWEVVYPGSSFALADTLSFYADDPRMFFVVRDSGKKINIERVNRGEIDISFR